VIEAAMKVNPKVGTTGESGSLSNPEKSIIRPFPVDLSLNHGNGHVFDH
jgi:hypothetical protein